MTIEEIKAAIQEMPNQELSALNKFIFAVKDSREPTISLRIGQIVEWTPEPEFGKEPRTLIGFSADDQTDVKSALIIEYMSDYKCLRLTRAPASKIVVHDDFVDLSSVIKEMAT